MRQPDVDTDGQAGESPVGGALIEGAATRADLERMRTALEASGDYRVLRRLAPRAGYADPTEAPGGARLYRALYLDTETTGFDPRNDKVIELAMLRFEYDAEGNVYGVQELYDAFEDPGRPLPDEVVGLTGITDDDVRGQRFDDAAVEASAKAADLVIAHNAAFDRPFMEKRFPVFKDKPWACSSRDIGWRALGFRSSSLEFLAFRRGFYYDAHRALIDCRAGLELLAVPLAEGEAPPMRLLRTNAAKRTARLWAESAPFEKKDVMKARGYRFNGTSRVWWADVPAEALDEELTWLASEVYEARRPLPYLEYGALQRYSGRVPEALPNDLPRR